MATPETRQLSITELERLLARRSAELTHLERERAKLRKQLSTVEQKIAAVGGATADGRVRLATSPARKRHKNAKSLKVLVVELLRDNKKGLDLKQLTDKVLKAGYKTASSNFSNTVYQAAYNSGAIEFEEKSGVYRTK